MITDEFRIWDKKEKRWCTDEYDVAFPCDAVSQYGYYIVKTNEDGSWHIFSDEEEKDRFDLETYIGLKDYFGNKIYEGDIVDGYGPFPKSPMIVCNNRYAKKHMLISSPAMRFWKFWNEDRLGNIPFSNYQTQDDFENKIVHVERIGTIHNNPEIDKQLKKYRTKKS